MRKLARKTGRLSKGILASAMGLLTIVSAGPARAADWSLKYATSTDFELNDNINASKSDKETGLKLTTRSSLDLLAKTKTQLFRISGSVQTRPTFFTPGDADWTVYPSIGAGYSYEGKRTSFSIEANAAQAPIRSSNLLLLNGLPILSADGAFVSDFSRAGNEYDYGVNLSIAHRLTKKDQFTWSAGFSATDYDVDTNQLEPNMGLNTALSWRHELTKLISMSASSGVSYYRPDKNPDNYRITWSPSLGVNAQLTKRFSTAASVGLTYADPHFGESTLGVTGSVSGNYKLKRTNIGLALSRDISTAASGTLVDRYSAQVNVAHSINDLMTWSLGAGYAFSPGDNAPDRSSFSISPALNYQFAKDWNSSLSYSFAAEDNDKGESIYTNALLLNLSYGKTLLK